MNIPQINIPIDMSHIKDAVRSVSEQNWINFFESLRQQQYTKIRSAETDAERLTIQNNVKGLDCVQELFSEMQNNKLDKLKE